MCSCNLPQLYFLLSRHPQFTLEDTDEFWHVYVCGSVSARQHFTSTWQCCITCLPKTHLRIFLWETPLHQKMEQHFRCLEEASNAPLQLWYSTADPLLKEIGKKNERLSIYTDTPSGVLITFEGNLTIISWTENLHFMHWLRDDCWNPYRKKYCGILMLSDGGRTSLVLFL